MTTTEIVYIGKDNSIDLKLSADSVNVDLSSVTRMVLLDVSCNITIDSDISPSAFSWSAGAGAITLSLGLENVAPGSYSFYLIVFDATNPHGIVWGTIRVVFKSVCPI